ncbi:MAG: hypothetical protein H6918_06070 [Sphingomonadaceae bacterium]|nr:hypothetical protein [Sphingomonadaceae bacterium]
MTNRIKKDAISIRHQIRATETLMDEAMLASVELMKRMITARQNPDVCVHEGQKAVMQLMVAQQHIVQGTTDLFRVHDELTSTARTVGILDEPNSTPSTGFTEADNIIGRVTA